MLSFFDCPIPVGRSGLGLPAPSTPEALLAVMDRYNVARALVYARTSFILKFCSATERLCPAICAAPPATHEAMPPAELAGFIAANGIKAVIFRPRLHSFSFTPFSLGPLLEVLQARRVPAIVSYQDIVDGLWAHRPTWSELRETATAFPDLPIVLLWTGMLQGRELFPLLERCPNVRADLSCVSFHFIEHVVERFGAGRLVFASHYPLYDPGISATWVSYSGVSQGDKEAIACGNLERLLGGTP